MTNLETHYPNPLILQRADPFIYRHTDGYYYFTASVPQYDRIELRRSKTLNGLANAESIDIWHKHDQGMMSHLIWAPELHFIDGSWLIYFAAAHSPEIVDGLFQHRMFALECKLENPLTGLWCERGQIQTNIDSFCLDASVFEHNNELYYIWAQKDPKIVGNSNLYLSKMSSPWELTGAQVMISRPEFAWEIQGFKVNEGPAVIKHNGRVLVTYSASATDENYCIGLVYADENADLLDAQNWHKLSKPLFGTNEQNKQFGPGHNSFTIAENGINPILVYHCRNYTQIEGDPLYDPNRHTRIQSFTWDENGFPVFGVPRSND